MAASLASGTSRPRIGRAGSRKGMYTEEELIEVVLGSPNNALYREIKEPPIQESRLCLSPRAISPWWSHQGLWTA